MFSVSLLFDAHAIPGSRLVRWAIRMPCGNAHRELRFRGNQPPDPSKANPRPPYIGPGNTCRYDAAGDAALWNSSLAAKRRGGVNLAAIFRHTDATGKPYCANGSK
jgi:hypothetical protein